MNDYEHGHPGACECGTVKFLYRCQQPLPEITARRCQCLYCAPRAASYLSAGQASLHVQVRDLRYLYAHRFGTNTADFMHCAVCNTQVFVRSEVEGRTYALVSAPALHDFAQLREFATVNYDGETLAQRLNRRSQFWIPELHISCEEPV
jgi:hypothetical protein